MEIIDAKALLVGVKIKFLNNEDMTEALNMGINALVKQVPRETIEKNMVNKLGRCPNCRNIISPFKVKFCSECGQKLQWV